MVLAKNFLRIQKILLAVFYRCKTPKAYKSKNDVILSSQYSAINT